MIVFPIIALVSIPDLIYGSYIFSYNSIRFIKNAIFEFHNKRVEVKYKLGDRTYLNNNVQNLNSFRRGIVLKYVINDEVLMDIKELDKVNYLHKYKNIINEDNENWYLYNYINDTNELVAIYKLEDFKYTLL